MANAGNQLEQQMSGLRMGTTYKEKCEDYMSRNNIESGTTKIENWPQEANYPTGGNLEIRTNMFKAAVSQPISVFQYDVKISGWNSRSVKNPEWTEISVVAPNDYLNMERREACGYLFAVVRADVREIQEAKFAFYYNRRSILYSTKALKEAKTTRKYDKKLVVEKSGVNSDDATQMAVFRNFDEFLVEITKAGDVDKENFTTDVSRSAAQTDVSNVNPEFIHFLDIVSSQSVMEDRENHVSFANGVSYYVDPDKHGYNASNLILKHGVYLAPGITKSARFIAEGANQVASAIVVEPKISPFHGIQTVAEKIEDLQDEQEMLRLLRGLYVYPAHLFRRSGKELRLKPFKIAGLGKPARDVHFTDKEGNDLTVAEYFETVHGYTLQRPNLPTIQVDQKSTGTALYYPMEVCEILDNQRLGTAAMTGDIVQRLIKECAVKPSILDTRIQDCSKTLNMHGSQYMKEAKIEVNNRPIELSVPVLKAPQLFYGTQPTQFDNQRSQWQTKNTRYTTGGSNKMWAIYAAVRSGPKTSLSELQKFAQTFMRMANQKGMRLQEPAECLVLDEEPRRNDVKLPKLLDRIQDAKRAGCRYVMVITQKEDVVIHASLKAYEQEFGVVTQNVTRKTLTDVLGTGGDPPKMQTLENVVNKANLKMGGLNYTIQPSGGVQLKTTDLIVGLCINHVAGGRGDLGSGEDLPPSVIGYAANEGSEASAFTGDFVYQPAMRGADLNALRQAVADVCSRYLKSHESTKPQRVIFYRNGVSEGDYAQSLQFEVPIISKAITDTFGQKVDFTVIVCTRLHNARFYPKNLNRNGKPREQNLTVGVVVDRGVVHPNIPEFYLASHCAQQGTSKIPRYAVLYNGAKMGMQEIHGLTHALAFGHQIINMPVSTPSPVFIAEQYAKRGRNLFNAHANDDRKVTRDFQQLTQILGYTNLDIRERRVNA